MHWISVSNRGDRRSPAHRMRRGLVAAAVAAGAAVLVTPSPVHALTITVTITADVIAADGQTSLREAVIAANDSVGSDIIVLGAGLTYSLTLCAETLEYFEPGFLIVEGNGSTIIQTCDAAPMWVGSDGTSSFDLRDVTLQGGPNAAATTTYGMAVLAGTIGKVRLDNVTVTGFNTAGGTVVEAGSGHGTAPYFMEVIDSTLTGNTGSVLAGDQVSVSIVSTSISNNTGSALNFADGWPLVVTNSTINNNTRTGIGNTGQGFKINAMTIVDSTVSGNGRAGISCSNCGDLTISGTTISNNGLLPAITHRGGVTTQVQLQNPRIVISVSNSVISGNGSDEAGAGLHVTLTAGGDPSNLVPQINVSGVEFASNSSALHGGGMAIETGVPVVTNSTFNGNAALGGDGGGLWYRDLSGPFDAAVSGSTFTDNTTSGSGGAMWLDQVAAASVTTTTMTNNTAAVRGGGAHVVALTLDVSQSRASLNDAVEGGGVRFVGDGLAINGSTFDGNTSVSYGGAVMSEALNTLARNSTFTANSSGKGGGVAVFDSFPLVLDHVTMAANSAIEGAHVWRNEAGSTTIRASALVTPSGTTSCLLTATTSYSFLADASCGSTATDEVSAADPQIGALAANGGPTPTMLPAASSPLGGQVALAACASVAVDQRGVTRPQGAACDAGAVEIVEAAAVTTISGTSASELIVGTEGADEIFALGGNDVVVGLGGDDIIHGGPGNDVLYGGSGDDTLIGGDGRDVLVGGPGIDTIVGGAGIDIIFADADDIVSGGPGPDVCFIAPSVLPRDC